MPEHHDVLVVGTGPAGTQVAVGLAAAGFPGSVGLVGAEPGAPYERPPLSKGFLVGEVDEAGLRTRPAAFWAGSPITLLDDRTVESIDAVGHTVRTSAGEQLSYGSLVWAAGCRARRLDVPGAGLDGVTTLRTRRDSSGLAARLGPLSSLVVVGGGYIGLEVAASATKMGARVTVVEAQERLLARVTGSAVSDHVARMHDDAEVGIELRATVLEFVGEGTVSGVRLGDGRILPADVVVVGIGVIPNVEPLLAAGARCPDGVTVDADGRTSLPDVFAAGDCACAATGTPPVRIESIHNAGLHAKRVVAALLMRPRPAPEVPWFWSNQFDMKLRTAGMAGRYDDAVLRGDPASGRFAVVYLAGDVVMAVDAVNSPRDFAHGKALVGTSVAGARHRLADPAVALRDVSTPAG